jgi:hypothetical protein
LTFKVNNFKSIHLIFIIIKTLQNIFLEVKFNQSAKVSIIVVSNVLIARILRCLVVAALGNYRVHPRQTTLKSITMVFIYKAIRNSKGNRAYAVSVVVKMIEHVGHLHAFTTSSREFPNQQRLVQFKVSRSVLKLELCCYFLKKYPRLFLLTLKGVVGLKAPL